MTVITAEKESGLNFNFLKIIAITTMLIDHVGFVFFPQYHFLRIIGRIAMPIFAFGIANGYRHTKDANNYLLRLLIFALIAEIPFKLCFNIYGNVIFTLALGLLAIMCYDKIKILALKILSIIAILTLTYFIDTDYGIYGVLMVLLFYIFYENRAIMIVSQVVLTFLYTLSLYPYWLNQSGTVNLTVFTQMYSVLALVLIIFYNPSKKNSRKGKMLFYVFYPLHLLAIWAIDLFLF